MFEILILVYEIFFRNHVIKFINVQDGKNDVFATIIFTTYS